MSTYVTHTERGDIATVRAHNVRDAAERATGTLTSGPSALRVLAVDQHGVSHVLMSDQRVVRVAAR